MTKPELRVVLSVAIFAGFPLGAAPQPVASTAEDIATHRFDGTWDATVSCPAVNENGRRAKGYVLQLSVEVKNGVLHGHYGSKNASTWLDLDGRIRPDGTTEIAARGRTGDPDYAVGAAQRGSPYAYNVEAHFDDSHGSGKRVELRPCDLEFVKR